jgi:phosphate transport system protein
VFTLRSRHHPGITQPYYGRDRRNQYQQQLDRVPIELVQMTGGVRAALEQATGARLTAGIGAAESVISADRAIDEARERIEEESFDILARQAPVAGHLRMLVAPLRMVADLERMGDLSVHVAKVVRLRFPTRAIPPVLVPTISQMAQTADEMIAAAAEIVATREVDAARELESADDTMDMLRRSMFRTLLSEHWDEGVEPAVDMAPCWAGTTSDRRPRGLHGASHHLPRHGAAPCTCVAPAIRLSP